MEGVTEGGKHFTVICTCVQHRWGKPFDEWGLELREMLLEPDAASPALLHATLKG